MRTWLEMWLFILTAIRVVTAAGSETSTDGAVDSSSKNTDVPAPNLTVNTPPYSSLPVSLETNSLKSANTEAVTQPPPGMHSNDQRTPLSDGTALQTKQYIDENLPNPSIVPSQEPDLISFESSSEAAPLQASQDNHGSGPSEEIPLVESSSVQHTEHPYLRKLEFHPVEIDHMPLEVYEDRLTNARHFIADLINRPSHMHSRAHPTSHAAAAEDTEFTKATDHTKDDKEETASSEPVTTDIWTEDIKKPYSISDVNDEDHAAPDINATSDTPIPTQHTRNDDSANVSTVKDTPIDDTKETHATALPLSNPHPLPAFKVGQPCKSTPELSFYNDTPPSSTTGSISSLSWDPFEFYTSSAAGEPVPSLESLSNSRDIKKGLKEKPVIPTLEAPRNSQRSTSINSLTTPTTPPRILPEGLASAQHTLAELTNFFIKAPPNLEIRPDDDGVHVRLTPPTSEVMPWRFYVMTDKDPVLASQLLALADEMNKKKESAEMPSGRLLPDISETGSTALPGDFKYKTLRRADSVPLDSSTSAKQMAITKARVIVSLKSRNLLNNEEIGILLNRQWKTIPEGVYHALILKPEEDELTPNPRLTRIPGLSASIGQPTNQISQKSLNSTGSLETTGSLGELSATLKDACSPYKYKGNYKLTIGDSIASEEDLAIQPNKKRIGSGMLRIGRGDKTEDEQTESANPVETEKGTPNENGSALFGASLEGIASLEDSSLDESLASLESPRPRKSKSALILTSAGLEGLKNTDTPEEENPIATASSNKASSTEGDSGLPTSISDKTSSKSPSQDNSASRPASATTNDGSEASLRPNTRENSEEPESPRLSKKARPTTGKPQKESAASNTFFNSARRNSNAHGTALLQPLSDSSRLRSLSTPAVTSQPFGTAKTTAWPTYYDSPSSRSHSQASSGSWNGSAGWSAALSQNASSGSFASNTGAVWNTQRVLSGGGSGSYRARGVTSSYVPYTGVSAGGISSYSYPSYPGYFNYLENSGYLGMSSYDDGGYSGPWREGGHGMGYHGVSVPHHSDVNYNGGYGSGHVSAERREALSFNNSEIEEFEEESGCICPFGCDCDCAGCVCRLYRPNPFIQLQNEITEEKIKDKPESHSVPSQPQTPPLPREKPKPAATVSNTPSSLKKPQPTQQRTAPPRRRVRTAPPSPAAPSKSQEKTNADATEKDKIVEIEPIKASPLEAGIIGVTVVGVVAIITSLII